MSAGDASRRMREYVERFAPLTDDSWEAMARGLRRKRLPAGQHDLRAGDTETTIRFISHGVVRQYYVRKDREFNKEIYVGPEFVSSYTSFLTGKPSPYGVQALEDSEVLVITRELLHDLYARFPCWEHIGRRVAEMKYILKERREALLLMESAEERYAWLHEHRPQLLRRVSLHHIAAYLGIRAETLSRIRAAPVRGRATGS